MIELQTLRDDYLRAQLEGDRAAALAVVHAALKGGLTVPRVQLEIVQIAQYEIGRLWETNAIGVSTEHQATAISQLALASLYDQLPREPSNGKRVLVSCVEGELHDMGSRIAADFLEMSGFAVRFLGASVPPDSLTQRALEFRPDLIALSATMSFHVKALREAISQIRASSLGAVPILVGGLAVTREFAHSQGLDIQGFGADAHELVAEARRITSA